MDDPVPRTTLHPAEAAALTRDERVRHNLLPLPRDLRKCASLLRTEDQQTADLLETAAAEIERLEKEALAGLMPTPAMQRALLGEPPDAVLTGSQSAEAISRYRALMEAARHAE